MLKTENYQLNKPEPTDPLRVEDFNQNADIIDAALGAVGNCKLACGTYIGTGTYGVDNPNTLSIDFPPKLIMVRYGVYSPLQLFANETYTMIQNSTNETSRIEVAWSEDGKTVSWYCPHGAAKQLNADGVTYLYIAWG